MSQTIALDLQNNSMFRWRSFGVAGRGMVPLRWLRSLRQRVMAGITVLAVGSVVSSSVYAQQIVKVKPPGKNREYVYGQATQLLAYWNRKPRPEIRVVYEESDYGNRIEYKYRVVKGVTIYARDTATGKPVGIFVDLTEEKDSARPPGGVKIVNWDTLLAKGATGKGNWVHYKGGKKVNNGVSDLTLKWDPKKNSLYVEWGNADPVYLYRPPGQTTLTYIFTQGGTPAWPARITMGQGGAVHIEYSRINGYERATWDGSVK